MENKNSGILRAKAEVLNALAHPLRLKILEKLRSGPCCVCKIIPYVNAEQSNVSHHLAILKNAGIVRCEKKGLEVWYEVVDYRVFEIIDILGEYVIESLKKKSELLKEMARK
ncbi:MAG: metalloregulator ArsR/SmtB family transcription factor [candidate division WOR-3 bacterium]|nr:metalloregulator ArsR/SmtB family transcription factor [candidate division WOR-3 bacterium]